MAGLVRSLSGDRYIAAVAAADPIETLQRLHVDIGIAGQRCAGLIVGQESPEVMMGMW